jgi:hypothetical protein
MRRAYLALFALAALSCDEAAGADARQGTKNDFTRPDGGKHDAGKSREDARVDQHEEPVTSTDEGASGLPCEVTSILAERCWSCHDETPQYGAPMSLTNLDELHAENAGEPYYQTIVDRIQRSGRGQMPPVGQPALSPAQKTALLDWIDAGAPAGAGCEVTPTADAGSQPETETDCDVSFELRATADFKDQPFTVPLADDHYECFYFKAEVDAETLATRLSPLLDKTNVLHHWLLFAADKEEAKSGTHASCSGIHPGAYLMAAWLPGTPELVLPHDVGMEMPSGPTAQFILENHYNNTPRYQGLTDDSGVKVCATNKPKPTHAAIHWLGSERISIPPGSKGSASGTCTPKEGEPITIMGVIPHMHRLGSYVNMTILRADGRKETLHDGPFEFENQGYFAKDVVLQPGDRVSTKCDYDNTTTGTVSLGERTGDEMCYMFTLAYPVGLMNTGGDLLNPLTGQPVVQGPNRCMK